MSFAKLNLWYAPLGAALRYSSGVNGLIGLADSWPNVGSDTRGVNAYDHYWQSFNPAIVWTSGTARSQVFAIPGVDHDPFPYENLEFIIFGSNDGTNWEEGKIAAIYRDGFDTANTFVGHSNDYTSLWTFSNGPYTQFMAAVGNHLNNIPIDIEGEIDSLAAPMLYSWPCRKGTLSPFGSIDGELWWRQRVFITHCLSLNKKREPKPPLVFLNYLGLSLTAKSLKRG